MLPANGPSLRRLGLGPEEHVVRPITLKPTPTTTLIGPTVLRVGLLLVDESLRKCHSFFFFFLEFHLLTSPEFLRATFDVVLVLVVAVIVIVVVFVIVVVVVAVVVVVWWLTYIIKVTWIEIPNIMQ